MEIKLLKSLCIYINQAAVEEVVDVRGDDQSIESLTAGRLRTSDVRYQDFCFDTISIRYWGKYRNFDWIFDNF